MSQKPKCSKKNTPDDLDDFFDDGWSNRSKNTKKEKPKKSRKAKGKKFKVKEANFR